MSHTEDDDYNDVIDKKETLEDQKPKDVKKRSHSGKERTVETRTRGFTSGMKKEIPSPTFESVYQDAMKLSPEEQQNLAIRLNASFNTEVNTPPPSEPSLQDILEYLKKIPLWEGKKKSGSAIEWLENEARYGRWLKHINNDRDYIYRQDIMNHDKKLVRGIENELSISDVKVREHIRTRTERIDDKKESRQIDTETVQIAIAIKQRESREARMAL